MTNTNTNEIFRTVVNGEGLYVERYNLDGKIVYQAMYDDGTAISELEEDSNAALMAAGKEIERVTK